MPDLTYSQLTATITALEKGITRAADQIRERTEKIDEIAESTARTADGIAALGVDTATVSETRELSRILRGVSEAAIAYANAGDTTTKAAAAAVAQARTTHAGIHEAYGRAPVDLSGVNREWLRQE
ncbi:hypothetical protein ACFWV1_26345 [Streptomyces sp. NPDC058700]|uniref:hypothetical protein n=1 Tax=Streptomyces sp. NPDC058700 TaxID=3346607 RepID=UPI003655B056